jgi:hypothetical protein
MLQHQGVATTSTVLKSTTKQQGQTKGGGLPPPKDWETKTLRAASLIEARTGNVRTYLVSRIKAGDVQSF